MPKVPKRSKAGDVPDATWSIRDITSYVKTSLKDVYLPHRFTAIPKHRLGRALFFAHRKLYANGQWNRWLENQNIPRTVAWEAIKLFESVKSEKDIEGLTATEAKIKYGIYPEAEERLTKRVARDSVRGNSGFGSRSSGGGGFAPTEQSEEGGNPEKLLSLAYHRLKNSVEALEAINWTAELLYLSEVDEMVANCDRAKSVIAKYRKRIKRPKHDSRKAKSFLSELDNV